MKYSSKIIASIYGILGAVFTLLGLVGLFNPGISVPEITGIALEPPILKLYDTIKHFTMELSASIIALGSLLLWGSFNVQHSQKLDYLFLGYFVLFSGLHWYEFLQGNRTIESPLVNSIPLLLFGVVIFLRKFTSDRG